MKRLFLPILMLAAVSCSQSTEILVEAENFENKGGWVTDVQAFPKICSSNLMAHGIGTPVKDASTTINIPKDGRYKVYVSTYNWTSPWYDGEGPGSFQVAVNGTTLESVVGKCGDKWQWQCAGSIELSAGDANVAFKDLTGYHGRVDAIYLTDGDDTPVAPTDMKRSREWRSKLLGFETIIAPKRELVVVGGGVAGCTTALSAARLGTSVAFIHNQPKLGGNNAMGVWMGGSINKNLYPKVGNIVREITGIPIPEDSHKEVEVLRSTHPPKFGTDSETASLREQIMQDQENLDLYINTYVIDIEMDGDRIVAVIGKDIYTGQETRYEGDLFADCTGDGDVGYLAGADFHIGREDRSFANEPSAPIKADSLKMGTSLGWNAADTGKPCTFATYDDIPWAMQCSDEYFVDASSAAWWWETGFNIDNALEPELVRDNMFRAIYGNWSYLNNNLEKYRNFKIVNMQYMGKKRESRRLVGDIMLNENDIINAIEYPDASFTTTWAVDLHHPTEENTKYFKGWEWQSYFTHPHYPPYHVPYRTLYSRNIENLFTAGRCLSVTHIALGTTRLIATLGMAGEVVGMAANICREYNTTPRGVYEYHLDKLIDNMKSGVPTKPNKLQLLPSPHMQYAE